VAARGRHASDLLIVAALARGATQAEAAKAANVGVRTVRRRMQEPAFRRQVDLARRELVDMAHGIAADALAGAMHVVLDILHSSSNDSHRLSAARTVFSIADGPRADPAARAALGAITIQPLELRTWVHEFFELGLDFVKPEDQDRFRAAAIDLAEGRMKPGRRHS
jgi:hypothetical protein